MTPKNEKSEAANPRRNQGSLHAVVMRDIPGMTVQEHHALSIGVLACCYKHVPPELQKAIAEAFDSAKQMGMNITPELVTNPALKAPNNRI